MWFAYMDEAGNTGLNLADPNQTIHLILTVALDESRVATLHQNIRQIAAKHFPDDHHRSDFEFHGHALFAGRDYFKGVAPATRIQVYEELLAEIATAEAKVVVRGVYKPGLAARYANPFHPHDIALMFTIESLERVAKKHDCRMLLVADEAREVEDAALRDLVHYQEAGTTWGWNTERAEHIVDTIHFVRSETNPAIQLADCATFIAARKRKMDSGEVAPTAPVEALWTDHIEPHVWRNSVWYPSP